MKHSPFSTSLDSFPECWLLSAADWDTCSIGYSYPNFSLKSNNLGESLGSPNCLPNFSLNLDTNKCPVTNTRILHTCRNKVDAAQCFSVVWKETLWSLFHGGTLPTSNDSKRQSRGTFLQESGSNILPVSHQMHWHPSQCWWPRRSVKNWTQKQT